MITYNNGDSKFGFTVWINLSQKINAKVWL